MATIKLNERTNNGNSTEERAIVPTDTYRMKCVEADIEDDTFNPNKDGSFPKKIKTVWEITALTMEQQEAADDAEETWVGVRIWHRFKPYYGDVRAGGPSQFKAFVDSLRAQGHLSGFNLEDFDTADLVDIEQKCSVLNYIKTMGQNAGQPGNKIAGFAPLRSAKSVKVQHAKEQPAPVKNTPEPVADGEDEPLF